MNKPNFRIGSHALKRWKERIDPRLTDDEIKTELNNQLTQLPATVSIRRGDDDEVKVPALFYRCRYKGRIYTAVVAPASDKPDTMTVATLFPTDEKIIDILAQLQGPWKDNRHLVRLRYLRTLWFDQAQCATILQRPPEEIQEHWEEAGFQDRRCGTCQLYGRSMHECMHYDTPTTAKTAACNNYIEDVWEVVRLAAAAKIPDEKIEQAIAMREKGMTWLQIAQKLGVSQATIYRRVRDRGKAEANNKKATPEVLEKAKQLRALGKSWRSIESELGISARTLRTYITEDPQTPASTVPEPEPEVMKADPPAGKTQEVMPEPVCDTCSHRPVCRYADIYQEHHEWALCRWWCA